MMETPQTWHGNIKFFHWTLFILVLIGIALVVSAGFFERGTSEKAILMMLHKSFGFLILITTILFIAAHKKQGRPPVIGSGWQIKLAGIVHIGMLLLLIIMPILGVLMSQFAQQPVSIFGLFSIPVVLDGNKNLAGIIHTLHANIAGPILIFLVLVHIGGALWHHLIDKDDTLKRMRPGNRQ